MLDVRGFYLSLDHIPTEICTDLLNILINHNFTHVFFPEMWGKDVFTQIAYLMAKEETDKLVYGTGIINIFSRSPATIIQSAASLSDLSDGRFVLGLGLSGPNVIRDWHAYYNSTKNCTKDS